MCGIAGIFKYRNTTSSINLIEVNKMLDAIKHRGPDGTICWFGRDVAMGLVRLAIVAQHEPPAVYSNSLNNLFSVFNGEIYNHQDLRKKLISKGYEINSKCDASLIPFLFDYFGESFVQEINGPYAIAIYDAKKHALHLFRDRVGKKPLFAAHHKNYFYFASEMKGLIAAGIPVQPDANVAARFLLRGYIDDENSCIKNIKVIPPGCHIKIQGQEEIFEWTWLAPFKALLDGFPVGNNKKYQDDLENIIFDATSLRAKTEVGTATLLSSGIDSTLVSFCAKEWIGQAFTMTVPGRDETDKARIAAKKIDLNLTTYKITEPTIKTFMKALWHLEYPCAYSSYGMASSTLLFAEFLSHKNIRVGLTGEGADELFLGYPWDLLEASIQYRWPLPKPQNKIEDIVYWWNLANVTNQIQGWDQRAWETWCFLSQYNIYNMVKRIGPKLLNKTVREEMLDDYDKYNSRFEGIKMGINNTRTRQLDGLRKDMLRLPILHCDRLFMAYGVELRMPFLDYRLMEMLLRYPMNVLDSLFQGSNVYPIPLEQPTQDKPLLRAIAKSILPKGFRLFPKKGFYVNSYPRQKELLKWIKLLVQNRGIVVDSEQLSKMMKQPESFGVNKQDSYKILWRAFVLEMTLRCLKEGPFTLV